MTSATIASRRSRLRGRGGTLGVEREDDVLSRGPANAGSRAFSGLAAVPAARATARSGDAKGPVARPLAQTMTEVVALVTEPNLLPPGTPPRCTTETSIAGALSD